MKRNSRHQAAIGGLLLLLVATGSAQASQLHLTPLYLAKSDCERRLDRCLQGCRAGGLESGMCVSLCYKERESCAAPQSDSSPFLSKQTLDRTSLKVRNGSLAEVRLALAHSISKFAFPPAISRPCIF